jgi:hypothetical protein
MSHLEFAANRPSFIHLRAGRHCKLLEETVFGQMSVGVIALFKVVGVQELRLTETSTPHFWAMNTYQVKTTFAQGAKCARSAAFVGGKEKAYGSPGSGPNWGGGTRRLEAAS